MKKISKEEDIFRIYSGDTVIVDLNIPDVINLLMNEARVLGCHLIYKEYKVFFFKDYKAKQRHELLNRLIF